MSTQPAGQPTAKKTIHDIFPLLTRWAGTIVLALGAIGFILSGFRAATTWSTMIFGALILILGWYARRREALYGTVSAAAPLLVASLLGLALTGPEVFNLGAVFDGTAEYPIGTVTVSAGAVVMFIYLLFALAALLTPDRRGQEQRR